MNIGIIIGLVIIGFQFRSFYRMDNLFAHAVGSAFVFALKKSGGL